jgi:hypothetical protein
MEPTELTFQPTQRPLHTGAGPLTAALSLAREFPHLPFSSLEVRNGRLSISLGDIGGDGDPAHFAEWVQVLGLTARKPLAFEHRSRSELALYASGNWAEVPVDVRAYVPADDVLLVVAA